MAIASLILASGRDVELVRLEVTTQGTWLEGYPSARWNDMALDALARSLTERYPHAGTHVIESVRTRPEPPDTSAGPFGPVEFLPAIRCIGVLTSHRVSEDADPILTASTLVVAWYQPDPVLTFDDASRSALRTLDWDHLARDHER